MPRTPLPPFALPLVADFAPAEAAQLLKTEDDASIMLTEARAIGPIQVARLLPHCVERFRGLEGGAFLPDDRAWEILRSAMSQQAPHGFAALSPSEAVATFASFDPGRIRALREGRPVSEVEQQRLDECLHEACQSNSGRGIESLMAVGARLRAPQHAIHAAARAGREQVMPALLAAGLPLAEVMRPDPQGLTPVFLAAQAGHAPVIRALHAAGVGPETLMATFRAPGQGGLTPAHCAHPEVIEELHEAGVSAEALMELDAWGKTPAHFAALSGDSRVIATLHKAGVSAEALVTLDAYGRTPVDYASGLRHVHVIAELHKAGVSAEMLFKTEREASFMLTPADVLDPIQAARLLPHCVERFPRLAGGEFLPDDRAREILRSAMSQQAPHGFAALSPSEAVATFASFDPQRIRALREGRPVSEVEQQRLDECLHEACQSNSRRGIESLVAAGARLRAPEQGPTAIHDAASAGREQVMPALLAAGLPLAEVMRPDPQGLTPVFLAAQAGHAQVIRALHAADVGPEDLMTPSRTPFMAPGQRGLTPVQVAAEHGHLEVIGALGEAGVSPFDLVAAGPRAPHPGAAQSAPVQGPVM